MNSPNRQPRAELRAHPVEGDGWTWCYVEPEEDVELYSNETYGTADDAGTWARRAYPDVPLIQHEEGAGQEGAGQEGASPEVPG